MSTRVEREYKDMLASDRVAWMRNREGLEVQVRILREYPDRYAVGHPDPSKNGREIRRMFKDEWEIANDNGWMVRLLVFGSGLLFLGIIIGCIISLLASR